MNVSLHYASLHYLNLWVSKEREIHHGFQSSKKDVRLGAIAAGAKHFSVARTLPRREEEDVRYGPVDEILDSLSVDEFMETPTEAVQKIERLISERYFSKSYGRQSVFSFTSKMLWLKFRSPIIIYDNRVRRALAKTSTGLKEYTEYCTEWRRRYDEVSPAVRDTCDSLVNVLPYVIDSSATKAQVARVSRESWFRERVFDSYLWHQGAA